MFGSFYFKDDRENRSLEVGGNEAEDKQNQGTWYEISSDTERRDSPDLEDLQMSPWRRLRKSHILISLWGLRRWAVQAWPMNRSE